MYVLVGGAGILGVRLAQQLLEMGHTVAVVDINSSVCQYAREKVGVMAFEGSAVSTTVLIEAGIRRAGSVVATLSSDALNLALVTLAKHYKVPHIVTRIIDSDFAEPYRIAGANHVISTIDLAVASMANAIEYPEIESMMHFEQGQIEVLKLSIPGNCYAAAKTVAEIAQDPHFPAGSLIIGYQPHPHEPLMIPNGQTVLEQESTILVVTKPGLVRQMLKFLGILESICKD
ncbi:TrkA family potassium uptake protein [Kamptonema animale CS-326]|jgi:trk system potassium uptake protein TrkA|uniref:potassium channel family protein n=1 Tax=Kamptonema animale TaxID=92934 RepID=UPI00232ECC83|nr:TrkA family potassium uptake protein [Kamptonema animale]MDB9511587.1 TrkA family potassium uptake protein [Kamptonema animale CS-326]